MLLRNNGLCRWSLSQVEVLSLFQSAFFDSPSFFKAMLSPSPLPAALYPAELCTLPSASLPLSAFSLSRDTHWNHCRHLTASCSMARNTVGHSNSQTHKQAPLKNQTNGEEVPQWRYLPTRLVPLPRGMLRQKPPSLIKSIKSSVLYFNPLHCNPVARRGAQAFHLIVSKQIVWLELTKGSFLYLCGNVSKKAGAGHSDSFA